MADKRIALELTVGLGDANKSLEELNQLLKQAKEELNKAGKGKKEFQDLEKAVKKTETQMAKSSRTTKTLNGTTKDLNKNLKATKDTSANLGGTLNDMSGVTGSLGSQFSSVKGVVGGVIKSFKTLKGAIIATGIGALVILLVALQKAFTTSEEGQNKFAKLMGVIGAVTGNLIDILADLGEAIIKVFEDPKQAIQDFADLIKDNITTRFEGLTELIPKLGQAIKLLFKGEFSEAGKVAADAAGKATLGVDSITDSIGKAIDKTKEFAAEQIKEGNQAAKVADMRAKADKIDRALIVSRSKLQSEIAELRLKARKEDEFSAAERKAALLEAQELENTLLNQETKALELRRDAQILENTFSRTDKENLDKEARARAAVNAQIAKRANVARQLQRELNTVSGQQEAEDNKRNNEAKAAAKEKADALEAIRLAEIISIEDKRKEEIRAEKEKFNELIKQAEQYGKDTADLKIAQETKLREIQGKFDEEDANQILKDQEQKFKDLETQKEIDEINFEERRADLARREAILLEDETLTDAQRLELQKKFAEQSKMIDDDIAANRAEGLKSRVQLAGDILGSLSALTTAFAKDDEESQKKAFNINKAISIGQAVISTAQGVISQLAVPQDAVTGANFVKAGIVAATGVAQIATISKTQFKSTAATKPDAPSPPSLGGGNVGTQPRGFTSPVIDTDIPTTKVIVTETDIRSVSRNVDGVYNRAVVVQ